MQGEHRNVDLAVIGFGLAGATLAWQAHERGLSVLIIDDADANAASRVAAGLVTPVTGGKLKPQPDFSALAARVRAHYGRVAEGTGVKSYRARPALRFLTEPRELEALAAIERDGNALLQAFAKPVPDGISADGTPVLMADAGRLAIGDYVDSLRRFFAARGQVIAATVDAASVSASDVGVRIDSLGVSAANAVFCRGYRDHDNPLFPDLGWRAAKGQILELDCPGFERRYTLHGRGIWMTAASDTTVLAGATYEWDALDATVTDEARDKLEASLRQLIELPYTVIDQRAAVRPIVEGRMPVIGRSPQSPRTWLMNGLGSKGALFAPTVAESLLAAIVSGEPIPARYCLERRVTAPA